MTERWNQDTPEDPSPPETGVVPDATPANFDSRVGIKAAQRDDEKEKRRQEVSTFEDDLKSRREHFAQLAEVAQDIAAQARESHIEPELRLESTQYSYRPHRSLRLGRNLRATIERPRRVSAKFDYHLGEGWLLARKAIAANKRMLVQEAMLGVDGKIQVYMREDIPNAATLLRQESYSRRTVQEASNQQITPPWGVITLARSPAGRAYSCAISTGAEYPFFDIEERLHEPKSLTPDIVQQGLEDFVVEHGLKPSTE